MRLDHGEDALNEVHEINVTPFIDVMLVLLIIFMVAAPLATVDIKVNLPAVSAKPQPRPDEPLYLTVKPDLSLALGDESVSRAFAQHAGRSGQGRQGQARLLARGQDRAIW
jgi:biopolymer transport protein ExbD